MKNYFWLSIILLAIIGCENTRKDNYNSQPVELTKKSSRFVNGRLSLDTGVFVHNGETWTHVMGANNEVEKEINFDDIQRVLFYQCQTEIEQNYPLIQISPTQSISCTNTTETENIENKCVEQGTGDLYTNSLCTQSIYTCIGYKNLELAESATEKTISGYAVDYNYTGTNTIPDVLPFYTESTFKNKVKCDASISEKYASSDRIYSTDGDTVGTCGSATFNSNGMGVDASPCNFSMTIGPQKPEIKTWLYRAALDAFERAGISASRVLRDPSGFALVMSSASKKEYGIELNPTLKKKFAVEFFEVIERYMETVDKLTANQLAVASLNSQTADGSKSRKAIWTDLENSRSAALKILLGKTGDTIDDVDGVNVDTLLPACETPVKNDSVRKAITFLRAAKPAAIFDGTKTISDVAKDANKVLTGNDSLVSDMTYNLGFGESELAMARSYLQNEKQTFRRINITKQLTKSGDTISQLEDLSEPNNLPPTFYQAQLMGINPVNVIEDESVSAADYFKSTTVVHPQRSAHEFLAYMRDSALKALSHNQWDTDDEVKKLYGHAAKMTSVKAGKYKLLVQTSPGSENAYSTFTIKGLFDMATDSRLVLVNDKTVGFSEDNAGYYCITSGKVGGVECTKGLFIAHANVSGSPDFDPDPVADFMPSDPNYLYDYYLQFSYYMSVSIEHDNLRYHVFLRHGTSPNYSYEYITSVDLSKFPAPSPEDDSYTIELPVGGEILSDAGKLTDRNTGECSIPEVNCTGINNKFVPSLETETMDDGDGYENSWKYYLREAKDAAATADALGNQLIENGLALDTKAEEAALALAEICGTAVSPMDVFDDPDTQCSGCNAFDEFTAANPSLSSCLPQEGDTIDIVSIGPKLSLWKVRDDGAYCDCRDLTGTNCPPTCPILTDKNKGSYTHSDLRWLDIPEENSLNLVYESASTLDEPESGFTCKKLNEFRDEWEKTNPDRTKLEGFYNSLRDSGWMDPVYFKALLTQVTLNLDPFYHYKLKKNENVIWSTYRMDYKNIPGQEGVFKEPWLQNIKDMELSPTEHAEYNPGSEGTYPNGETSTYWFYAEWQGEYVKRRILLGSRLSDIFKTLSILAATRSGYSYPSRDLRGDSNDYVANRLPYTSFPYRGISVDGSPDGLDEDGRVCVRLDSNDIDNYRIPEITPYDGKINEYLSDQKDTSDDDARRAVLKANYYLAGSMNRCDFENSRIYFDDYHKFTGQEYPLNIDEKIKALWLDGGTGITLKEILVEKNYQGLPIVDDVRSGTCEEPYRLGRFEISREELTAQVDVCLDGHRLFDALEFACHFAEVIEPSCTDVQDIEASTFTFNDELDLVKLAARMKCAANEINDGIQRMLFYNVPKAIVDTKNGNGEYANYQGAIKTAYIDIDTAMVDLAGSIKSVPEIMHTMGLLVKSSALSIRLINQQSKIADLNAKVQLWRTYISLIETLQRSWKHITDAFTKDAPKTLVTAGANLAINLGFEAAKGGALGYIVSMQHDIIDLQRQAAGTQVELEIQRLMTGLSEKLIALSDALDAIQIKSNNLNKAYDSLNSLKKKAEALAGRAALAGSNSAGQVYPTNTVMRQRYNTNRIMYEQALERAKKAAFVARRAIEFRLGENMSEMHQSQTMVNAPSEWVDSLCTVTGINYSEIRTEATEDASKTGDYSAQYIGNYVQKLSDFMSSYSSKYPYMDGDDIAVISMKDDILKKLNACEVESYNILYFSGNLKFGGFDYDTGVSFGWARDENLCTDAVGGPLEGSCLDVKPENIQVDDMPLDATSLIQEGLGTGDVITAISIRDATGYLDEDNLTQNYPAGTLYGGYYEQVSDYQDPGNYGLSFWYKNPGYSSAKFKVELIPEFGNTAVFVPSSWDPATPEQWQKVVIPVSLNDYGRITVRIYPSEDDESPTNGRVALPVPGRVLVWGLQLQKTDHTSECVGFDCETQPYAPTTHKRVIVSSGCPDLKGTNFRKGFKKFCTCINNFAQCTPQSDDYRCFWEQTFTISLDEIEKGYYLPTSAIAEGNFNYRHKMVAVNLVGTNLINCEGADAYNCFTNAYIPYTLIHNGSVKVRNHQWITNSFDISTAKIEHAKALAAEVVVTNPMTSNHQSLIAQYEKKELRGRPLNGTYTIRIWDTPYLNWNALEDIQLIWRYHYWARHSN
ncbi:hypothetical protein KKF34_07335 [Myxococcota bacterium]|nr:hypothetical protein [Myxococcota bacterium]MBU1379215.1 hypothetical protein [Myxococcota bacterium]MBU1496672.1 hypothetical protein [Myxococcota bacterium]